MTRDELVAGWGTWPTKIYRVTAPDGRQVLIPYKLCSDGIRRPDWPNLTDEQLEVITARGRWQEEAPKKITGQEWEAKLYRDKCAGVPWAVTEWERSTRLRDERERALSSTTEGQDDDR